MPKKAVLAASFAVVVLFSSSAIADTLTPLVSSGCAAAPADLGPGSLCSSIVRSGPAVGVDSSYLLPDLLTNGTSISDSIPEAEMSLNLSQQGGKTSARHPKRLRGLRGGPGTPGSPLTDPQLLPVPEPASLLLLGFGLAGLAVLRTTFSK